MTTDAKSLPLLPVARHENLQISVSNSSSLAAPHSHFSSTLRISLPYYRIYQRLSIPSPAVLSLASTIKELPPTGFRCNQSTDLIQRRAVERQREGCQNAQPGVVKCMQFTVSVDQPSSAAMSAPSKKPDYKPSAEFKDNTGRRARASARSAAVPVSDACEKDAMITDCNDGDRLLTQRGRKNDDQDVETSSPPALRFLSLFSNDFGPSALLYPTPTLTTSLNYGEGVASGPGQNTSSDSFSIPRPTIELAFDDFFNGVDNCRGPAALIPV